MTGTKAGPELSALSYAIFKVLKEFGLRIGAGKIFVMPLEECIRIRTEETGHDAIG